MHNKFTSNVIYLKNVQDKINNIDEQNKIIAKKNKKRNTIMGFGAFIFLIGSLMLVWGLIEILVPLFLTTDTAINVSFVGLIGFLIGLPFAFIKPLPLVPYPEHYLSLEEAMKMKDEYNSKLKEKLGLPQDFDVIK
jgi:hypothetical protein